MKFKNLAYLLLAFCTTTTFAACNELDGDNSDFDFGHSAGAAENPYKDGYGRLPNSIRLATYNTHRCEGWETQTNVDRANYNNTAKVISLIDPDVIALQELDKFTTWHPHDQLQELADRTGMKPYYCKTIDYRGGDYGIGILSKREPLRTVSGDLPAPRRASSSSPSSTITSSSPPTSATSKRPTGRSRWRSSTPTSPPTTHRTPSPSSLRATSTKATCRRR